jgi:hypothetical protein
MLAQHSARTEFDQPMVYQIRLKGQLGCQWAGWFAGLTITLEENGNTVLTGPVVDQSALHALLRKVRDLGMPLLSVVTVEVTQINQNSTDQTFNRGTRQ